MPVACLPGRDSSAPLAAVALELAQLGFRVFPCKRDGKKPAVAGNLRAATTKPAQILSWWERFPGANVGIAAHGLIILDADTPEAVEQVEAQGLPATATVSTRRGRHYYFRGNVPEGCRQSLDAGLDVKGNRASEATGYAVAPGSVCKGFTYEWHRHPAEFPIAQAPAELLDRVRRQSLAAVEPIAEGEAAFIFKGSRNSELTSYAGRLFRAGVVVEAELHAALAALNESRCRPPLSDAEVGKLASSAARTFDAPPPWAEIGRAGFNWAADAGDTPTEKLTLIALSPYADAAGNCWPSLDTLQADTGLGRNSQRQALAELERKGAISRTRRQGTSTLYTLHRARLQAVEGTRPPGGTGSTTLPALAPPTINEERRAVEHFSARKQATSA